MLKFDCVLFDLDGTLLDTLSDLTAALNHTMDALGCSRRTREEVRVFVGNGIGKLLERAMPAEKRAELGRAYEIFCSYYAGHVAGATVPYAGMPELIASLKARGIRLGVVSNKAEFAARLLVEKFYPGAFGFVLGARENLPQKPAPDGVFLALRELGAAAERTAYVGDSDVDYHTAHNAGLTAVAVSWGFRPRSSLAALPVYALCDEAAELERVLTEEKK